MPTRHTTEWLLLYATPGEAALVQSRLTHCRTQRIAGLDYLLGRAGRHSVVAIATGIGQANAAFAAGIAMAAFSVKKVLSFGIAGGYAEDRWPIGAVALGQLFGLGDEGVIGAGGWADLGAIGIPLIRPASASQAAPKSAPSRTRPSAAPAASLNRIPALLVATPPIIACPAGILTVVSCSGLPARAAEMRRRAARLCQSLPAAQTRLPWVEDMETAAIALACARSGKPLLALRGISNRAGDRDKSRWDIRGAATAAQAAAWQAITGKPWKTIP